MGKDATNTFFAENQAVAEQRDNSGLKGEPFKGEQFNSSDSRHFKESSKADSDAFQDHVHEGLDHRQQPLDMGISREMQEGGLELRKPAGGLHGDKWQDVHDGGQFKGAPRAAQLMDAPPAGGMHGDRWQQPALGDQFRGETILRPQGEQSSLPPTSTFKALEGAPLMEDHFKTAELKSHSLHSDLPSEHGTTNFHDGRFRDGRDEPALHENQILQPALHASKLEDNTLRDATIHGGHSRPLVPESSALDQLPLADRVVAGVHAGDPLSSATLKKSSVEKLKAKKDKKFKKEKDKKLERSTFGQDAHLQNDDALIPHDHLKKDQPVLADQHLAGVVPVLQKQERFDERLAGEPVILKKDQQLMSRAPLVQTFIAAGENHIVQEEGTLKQTSLKKDKKKDKKLKKDKHFINDAHLNKDANLVDSNAFNRDVNFHDGRDSAFAQDSQLSKDKDLNKDAHLSRDMNRQDAFLVTEDHGKTGSGKKGGKLKDKLHSKKEKLKAKLGMKKEEDLALADSHAHSDTHAPKGHEIATIKIPGIESGDRAAQEMVNHQAKAKKELNAELKEHAGHSDHLAPSEITGLGHGMEKMQLHENRALDSQPLNPNADQITRNQVQAKSELNAEIKSHAGQLGSTGHMPSQNFSQDLQFGRDSEFARDTQFARDSQQDQHFNKPSDALEKDAVLAKNEVNAEIKKAAGHGFFGATDHIQPSDVAHTKPGFTEAIKEKAIALKDQLQPMPAATLESRQVEAERLAGVAGTDDLLMKDHMLAKQGVNAEIKKAAGHGFFGATDHIQPSDVAPKPIIRDVKHFEGEELAGLSGFEDRNNILVKKDVNAEIKKAAGHGIFGATDHIQPSDVAPKPGFTDMIKNAALAVKDQFFQSPAKADARQLEAERLAGLSEVDDSLMKDNMLAKKGVNAEVKAAAGPAIFGAKDHIMPSKVAPGYPHREVKHFEGEQLAGLSGNEDVLCLQSKKDVNVEIAKAGQGIFGAKDHIMPSKVSSGYPHRDTKHFEGEQLANLSGIEDSQSLIAKKDVNAEIKKAAGHGLFGATDHIQPSAVAPKHVPKHVEGEQLAGLSGFGDSQSMEAKKSINAEIKHAGHGFFGTHDIHPSDIAPKHISKKVEGEQLAGLDAANDLLMQDNMLAKKGVNAEIKKTAGHGIFGAPDHILPSDVGKPTIGESIKEKATNAVVVAKDQANIATVAVMDKANIAATAAKDQANSAAAAAKDKVIAVKDQAIAVKEQYKPSAATIDARNLEAQRLAGFSAEDSLAKENVLAKKDVNAEIKQVAGTGLFASDHIMPSDVIHSQQGLGERIKDKAANATTAVKGQFQSAGLLEGEKLAGLSETNDALMKDNIIAKKEVNAEIKAFGSDNIHPSDISPAPAPGGVTVIHDGRSDHLGSDRLKSEMDYEQAQGTAVQGHHLPSVTALLKGTVATAASVAMAAASAVKGQFQAVSSREVSKQDFPSEFQKEDFEKELGVGAVKESDMNDDIMKDSILAKKDVNAEIKEHAPALGDSILPSDITGAPVTDAAHPSMTEMIKERVANAASTVKETLQNLH